MRTAITAVVVFCLLVACGGRVQQPSADPAPAASCPNLAAPRPCTREGRPGMTVCAAGNVICATTLRAPGSVQSTDTLEQIEGLVTRAEGQGGWLLFTFHHVCDGCAPNAISPDKLDALLAWSSRGSLRGQRRCACET